MPSATYSIARARLNAGIVDLVRTGSEMGAPANGCSVKVVEMLTICPDFCLRICATTLLRYEKVSGHVRADHHFKILGRIFGERLRNVDARIVDEEIDAPQLLRHASQRPI